MNIWNTGTTTPSAGAPASDTPEWLQSDDSDIHGSGSMGGGGGGATTSPSFADETSTDEGMEGNKTNKRSSKGGSTDLSGGNGSKDTPPPGTVSKVSMCNCKTIFLSIISFCFLGLFVYSATTQDNDVDGLQWMFYYAVNATLVAVFIVYYACCFPLKVLYLLSTSVVIWSCVYIVIAALKLSDTPKGGDDKDTGDNDNMTLREEYAFELAGASLGLFSAMYHVFIAKCCVNKAPKTDE
jgi:hypothetical protein